MATCRHVQKWLRTADISNPVVQHQCFVGRCECRLGEFLHFLVSVRNSGSASGSLTVSANFYRYQTCGDIIFGTGARAKDISGTLYFDPDLKTSSSTSAIDESLGKVYPGIVEKSRLDSILTIAISAVDVYMACELACGIRLNRVRERIPERCCRGTWSPHVDGLPKATQSS